MGQTRRILVSGASGLIGSALQRAANEKRIEVQTLVRRHREVRGPATYWNPAETKRGVHPAALEGFDAVVLLNGANIARRWSRQYRETIVSSRVRSTEMMCDVLRKVRRPPPVLLCASAVGIYGDRGDELLTEESSPGSGFLAETCQAWEAAAATGPRSGHPRGAFALRSRAQPQRRSAGQNAAARFASGWAANSAVGNSG